MAELRVVVFLTSVWGMKLWVTGHWSLVIGFFFLTSDSERSERNDQ